MKLKIMKMKLLAIGNILCGRPVIANATFVGHITYTGMSGGIIMGNRIIDNLQDGVHES